MMTLDQARSIYSLTRLPGWRVLMEYLEENFRRQMETALRSPATPHDLTQYNRGGLIILDDLKDLSLTAYNLIVDAAHSEREENEELD